MHNIVKFIIAVGICLAAGYGGSFFTAPEIDNWYQTIQKPSWNPPSWVFGPVWTTLYVMMGVALFLVWKSRVRPGNKRIAILLFAVQLVLNFFWSLIFFRQHEIGLALVEISLLWFTILLSIFAFAKISKPAAWLLVPYISWVSFATILNFTIWQLNN